MSEALQLIPDKFIQRGEKIGEGGFGEVYKGTWQGYRVAIKTLRLKQLSDALKEEFQREARVMAKLNHPGVIRLYGVCMEPGKYAMLMELMPKGDLYHLLSDQGQTLPWGLRWQLAIDIGAGLSYLHTHRILHRDLKSLNILLDGNLRAKITDFGLAKLKVHSSSLYTNKSGGSMPWMAPELFARRIKLTPKSDVYAYGMVLWEIASRKIPFNDAPNLDLMRVWIKEGEREKIPKDCPKPFAQVIQRCWQTSPETRPTALEAYTALEKARPSSSSQQPSPSMKTPTTPSSSPQQPLPSTKTLNTSSSTIWYCLYTLEEHTKAVCSLVVLPSGNFASGSNDNTIKIWNSKTGQCIRTLRGHWSAVCSLAALPSGQIVSGSSDKTIKIWKAQTGKCLHTLNGHKDGVYALVTLPSGQIVSGSNDKTIKIWHRKTGKCLRTLKGHKDGVCSLAALTYGQIVSGSNDKTIKIWNSNTGKCLRTFNKGDIDGHWKTVWALAILLSGNIASGSWDHTIKIWNSKTGECLRTLGYMDNSDSTREGHTNAVNALAILPSGNIASGSSDNTIKIWNSETGKCLHTLKGHTSYVYALAVLPSGNIVSGSNDNTIKIWS